MKSVKTDLDVVGMMKISARDVRHSATDKKAMAGTQL